MSGDIKELPSWEYFGWGILNGLFLGISIRHGVDISQEGIFTMVLDAFKPLFQSANLSTGWITFSMFLLGMIGVVSLGIEAFIIYYRGWPQRIIAICGFLSMLLLVLGVNFGAALLILGVIMVCLFPEK